MKAQRSATIGLITIICGFFLWQKIDPFIINNFYLPPLADMQSYGQWYRLFTVALTHANLLHLGFNMYSLMVLGNPIEAAFGKEKFLAIFFLSLLSGSLVSNYFAAANQPSVGASGAVFGLFGAMAVVGRKIGADIRSIAVIVGINFAFGFALGGVDWRAHLGGLIGGAIASTLLLRQKR